MTVDINEDSNRKVLSQAALQILKDVGAEAALVNGWREIPCECTSEPPNTAGTKLPVPDDIECYETYRFIGFREEVALYLYNSYTLLKEEELLRARAAGNVYSTPGTIFDRYSHPFLEFAIDFVKSVPGSACSEFLDDGWIIHLDSLGIMDGCGEGYEALDVRVDWATGDYLELVVTIDIMKYMFGIVENLDNRVKNVDSWI